MLSLTHKWLFTASEQMNCVVRLKFTNPADPASPVIIVPHPAHDNSPYTCSGEAHHSFPVICLSWEMRADSVATGA